MKKLILISCACLFTMTTMGQAKFTVPAPTDLQKYGTAAWQWNGAYVILIKYAKSLGQTVEEAATAVGEMAAATWNQNMTFDDLVNNILYINVVMAPSGKVEIPEQSADKIIIAVTDFYKPLYSMLSEFGVTREELSRFYGIYSNKIAGLIGANCIVNEAGEVTTFTISKN